MRRRFFTPNPSYRVLLCSNTVTLRHHRYYVIIDTTSDCLSGMAAAPHPNIGILKEEYQRGEDSNAVENILSDGEEIVTVYNSDGSNETIIWYDWLADSATTSHRRKVFTEYTPLPYTTVTSVSNTTVTTAG
jgi:hypothetical protein